MNISAEYNKKNKKQLKELLLKEELTPMEIKTITALERVIEQYESITLSKESLRVCNK